MHGHGYQWPLTNAVEVADCPNEGRLSTVAPTKREIRVKNYRRDRGFRAFGERPIVPVSSKSLRMTGGYNVILN